MGHEGEAACAGRGGAPRAAIGSSSGVGRRPSQAFHPGLEGHTRSWVTGRGRGAARGREGIHAEAPRDSVYLSGARPPLWLPPPLPLLLPLERPTPQVCSGRDLAPVMPPGLRAALGRGGRCLWPPGPPAGPGRRLGDPLLALPPACRRAVSVRRARTALGSAWAGAPEPDKREGSPRVYLRGRARGLEWRGARLCLEREVEEFKDPRGPRGVPGAATLQAGLRENKAASEKC